MQHMHRRKEQRKNGKAGKQLAFLVGRHWHTGVASYVPTLGFSPLALPSGPPSRPNAENGGKVLVPTYPTPVDTQG
jgi:hypothetical protein